MNNIPIFSILVALITTFFSISFLRPLAKKIGLLDRPNSRKLHNGHIPLIGGIAMYMGVIISILLTSKNLNELNYFILTSGIILALGIVDDISNIPVSFRLGIQGLVAIFIVTVGGVTIESFGYIVGSSEIFLGNWSYFVSVIAIIAAMNAINMSDGIHGLAGITSLIAFFAVLYLCISTAPQEVILIVILFCSTIPVFLVNNICIFIDKSRRIFMGDAGSMLLGLSIVWLLINLSQGGEQSFAPVIALWLLALPLIEMGSIILRRLIIGKSPFKPDSLHTHHILLHLGFSKNTVLLVLSFFSLLMAITGILGELYEVAEWIMFVGFLLISVIHFAWCLVAVKKIKQI